MQVSVRELHNSMVIPPGEGRLKEAKNTDNNIILSYSTLCNILPPQLKNMTEQYKVICGYECWIYDNSIHPSLLTCLYPRLKHLKGRGHNAQNRRYGKRSSHIFETYNSYVQPPGCHIYNTTSDIAMEKVCPCTSKYHRRPHWKCMLNCCDKCPSIILTIQEANKDTANMCPTTIFNVYRNFSYCTVHRKRPYHGLITCSMCSTVTSSGWTSKFYTQNNLC